MARPSKNQVLSRRAQVLRLFLERHSAAEIGNKLGISRQHAEIEIKYFEFKPHKTVRVKAWKRKPTPLEQFQVCIDKTPGLGRDGDCWEWRGKTNRVTGYGLMQFRGKRWYVHQLAYFLANRKSAERWVLHHCDNRPCVNPKHLYDGTPSQNAQDRERRFARERQTHSLENL